MNNYYLIGVISKETNNATREYQCTYSNGENAFILLFETDKIDNVDIKTILDSSEINKTK